MVDRLAGDLPAEAREEVIDRAEGNPFFVEELLQSLQHEGRLAAADSIQSLIAARIDRLPAEERAALQAAAVAGRTFWRGAVADVIGRPRISLDLTRSSGRPGCRRSSAPTTWTRRPPRPCARRSSRGWTARSSTTSRP